MSTSRHHHYLSQCYLKGFTKGNAKNSKLTVFDLKTMKKFETKPRNVGGMRDFNRVDIPGIDPEIVEKQQSEFEGKVATALKCIEETLDFSGDTKNLILELVGMLAIKSPEMRKHIAEPQIEIAKRFMAMSLDTKERWEAQIDRILEETGEDISQGKTYEEMKEFFDSKEYNVEVTREHQIHMELIGMQRITELLHFRNWVLLKAGEDAGEFITTDNPVSLTWTEPQKVPGFVSPGFGLRDTMVYFPVTKNLALVGEFDIKDETRIASRELVAILNRKIIDNSYQRVISSKSNFNFLSNEGKIEPGNNLLLRA
ncbi:TPA: DUF4238 domain-containing protein [Vibrio parahaemolyticus]